MYWDRFDIAEAYFCYAMLHHGGQWSKEYSLFSVFDRIRFKPRPMLRTEEDLGDNSREIFDRLVETKGAGIRHR